MKIQRRKKELFTVREMVRAALMAALIFVVTFLVRIPVPMTSGGYINLGDTMILLAAWLICTGRRDVRAALCAAAAAGLGSGLADLSAGAVVYILATLLIKGAMGFVAHRIVTRHRSFPGYVAAAVCGGAIMIGGYFLFEFFFFSPAYALGALPFNGLQWGGSVATAAVLYPVARQMESRV